MRLYIISILSLCISVIALAAATSRHSSAADEATRIEIDQKARLIRFVIDGQERAVLDAAGLHVKDNIAFVGKIIDVGPEGYAAARGGEAHAE